MLTIPKELQQAVRASHGHPLRLTDPETHVEYVLLQAELYDQIHGLLDNDSPLTPDERRAVLIQAGLRAGWDDPDGCLQRPGSSAIAMQVHRGEVVLVDFPYSDNTGSKVRPALVVQADAWNQRLDDTILALITSSRHRRLGAATQLVIDITTAEGQQTGLRLNSVIQCENLLTYDQAFILRILGRLKAALMGSSGTTSSITCLLLTNVIKTLPPGFRPIFLRSSAGMTTLFLAAQRSTTQAGDARLICRPGPFLQGLTLLYMPIRLDLGERRGLRFPAHGRGHRPLWAGVTSSPGKARRAFEEEETMPRMQSVLMSLGSLVVGVLCWSLAVTYAQQAPTFPLDDKLANEPAPWTQPGKWGKRGNWGRWGEDDKRGMLNFITPEMIVKAAGLVKQGKVYALGEELHSDVARFITPARVGVQVIQENDGYDRVAKQPSDFDPKRYQGAGSFTFMHNHTGTHLDTFAHIYRENSLYNNMPPPKPVGTVHGDAASVKFMVGRGVLLDVAKYKGQDPLPAEYWITLEDLQNTAKAQKTEIQKGDILLIRTGWRKMWDEPGDDGRVDLMHRKWHQTQPGIGPDSLAFLNEMEIVAIGADNAAVEWGFPVKPNYVRKAFGFHGLPIHPDFLWSRGAYIIEIMNLDELAKDQAYEFLFVLGPLLLRGGIGIPVNPIAIR